VSRATPASACALLLVLGNSLEYNDVGRPALGLLQPVGAAVGHVHAVHAAVMRGTRSSLALGHSSWLASS
jgi:hypothetical protein